MAADDPGSMLCTFCLRHGHDEEDCPRRLRREQKDQAERHHHEQLDQQRRIADEVRAQTALQEQQHAAEMEARADEAIQKQARARVRQRRQQAASARVTDVLDRLRDAEEETDDAKRWVLATDLLLELERVESRSLHPDERLRLDTATDRARAAVRSARLRAGEEVVSALTEWREVFVKCASVKLDAREALNTAMSLCPDLGAHVDPDRDVAKALEVEARLRSKLPDDSVEARAFRGKCWGPDSLDRASAEAAEARRRLAEIVVPPLPPSGRLLLVGLAVGLAGAFAVSVGLSAMVLLGEAGSITALTLAAWIAVLLLAGAGALVLRSRAVRDADARRRYDEATTRQRDAARAIAWEHRLATRLLSDATKRREALERYAQATAAVRELETSELGARLSSLRTWRPDLTESVEFVDVRWMANE